MYSPVAQNITLEVITPLGVATYLIAAEAGKQVKLYSVLSASKTTLASYRVSAASPFALFKRDCEMRVKEWGSTGPYVSKNPFGDISRADGAKI